MMWHGKEELAQLIRGEADSLNIEELRHRKQREKEDNFGLEETYDHKDLNGSVFMIFGVFCWWAIRHLRSRKAKRGVYE